MTLGTKIVLSNVILIWFELIIHNIFQPNGFVLLHSNVLPDDTV